MRGTGTQSDPLDEFRRLVRLPSPEAPPWDLPAPAAENVNDPNHYDYRKARFDLTKSQGYADLSPSAKLKTQPSDALEMALALLVSNPTSKAAYIKDPQGMLTAAGIEAQTLHVLTGTKPGASWAEPSYGLFGFHNGDREIYADGSDVFKYGEWGYAVTQALDTAQNTELEKRPPKVVVTRIKGKTSDGWRIAIDKPLQHYKDVGLKAAEKKAAELAKQGIYPDPKNTGRLDVPEALAKKWMRK